MAARSRAARTSSRILTLVRPTTLRLHLHLHVAHQADASPHIALKYKQYSKVRDILGGKIPPPAPPLGPAEPTHGHQQRKRSQSDAALPPQTPSKRAKPVQTPSKTQHFQPETMAAVVLTPSLARAALTPVAAAVPTSVSPTPQKDGRILGLFDLLSGTPSRSTVLSAAPSRPFSAVTPSKRRATDVLSAGATTTPTTARFAITPQSKRTTTATTTQLLFPTASTTPRRHDKNNPTQNTTPFKTPSTNRVTKRPSSSSSSSGRTPTSSTPSFLRRRTLSITGAATATATLSRVDEQDEDAGRTGGREEEEAAKAVGPLRLPRKLGGIGRSLSSVVAGLRKLEEEAFEEEEEAMREMEMEMDMAMGMEMGMGGGSAMGVERKGGVGEVVVGDSQAQGHGVGDGVDEKGNAVPAPVPGPGGLLSGFDDEALYDSLDEEKQRGQQPLRQFKKRGQKRTTRLVNMRPTRARRPAQGQTGAGDHGEEDEDDLVPETQFKSAKTPATTATDVNELRLSDLDSDLDFDGSASDGEEEKDAAAKTKQSKKSATAKKTAENPKTEGVVKRAVRKVKATAHANFKRLKLRNTGSKGGPGHNSRFRRRR